MKHSLSHEEVRLRGTLLSSNSELLQLHKSLVQKGILTEEEFWETRQDLLKKQEALLSQKRPQSSQLTSDLQPVQDHRGEQKLILTQDMVQSLLQQNPALGQAHRDLVPSQMHEKEFWTLYVRSKFFKSSQTGEENPLDKYYEVGNQAAEPQTLENVKISRLVDISATQEDHFTDYGNKTLKYLKSVKGEEAMNIIRKLNIHSMRILKPAWNRASALPVSIEDSLVLEDLSKPEERPPPKIGIQKAPSLIRGDESVDQKVRQAMRVNFLEDFSKVKLNLSSVLDMCRKTAAQRKSLIAPYLNTNIESTSAQEPSVPHELKLFHSNTSEVLRHFWASYPPGKEQTKVARLERMATILRQLKEHSNHLILAMQLDQKSLLSSVLQAIDWALDRYDEYIARSAEPPEKRARE